MSSLFPVACFASVLLALYLYVAWAFFGVTP